MADEILTERRGRVLVITLNRPEQMNSINAALAAAMVAAVGELDADPELSVGVVTGSGRGFSAGMDLKAFAAGENMVAFMEFLRNGSQKPLVAAIEGFCLAGGLEIALTCDLLVAAEDVKFGITEVKVGLFAAGGGLMRLPRRVPYGVAMEMALTADPIPAARALELGLIARMTEKGGALEGALALAERIARNAPLGLAASKQLIRQQAGRTEEEFWEFQVPFHNTVFSSADGLEGARAFAEKRTPNWTGR